MGPGAGHWPRGSGFASRVAKALSGCSDGLRVLVWAGLAQERMWAAKAVHVLHDFSSALPSLCEEAALGRWV